MGPNHWNLKRLIQSRADASEHRLVEGDQWLLLYRAYTELKLHSIEKCNKIKKEQIILGFKISKERSLGYIGGLCNLLNRRLRESLLSKELARNLDQTLSSQCLFALSPSSLLNRTHKSRS